MKTYALFAFSDWVKSVGGQKQAAELLNVTQGQVSRWVVAGACISADGTIYPPSPSNYTKVAVETKVGVDHA